MNQFKFDLQRFDDETNGYLRENLQGFVPKPMANEIIKDVVRGSSVLRLSNVQQMDSETKTFPIFAGGLGAYWTNETERIKTTTAKWIFPELRAHKIAVIVPVTREKMADTTINVFGEIKQYLVEAFHKTIDLACLFGVNSPFAKNIYDCATANQMAVEIESNARLDLDVSDMMALVEAQGLDVNGFVGDIGFKNQLRKLRDGQGNPLYAQGVNFDTLYSLPIEFARSGAWDKTKALCIAGNWKYSIVGIREEIQFEVLREATLQNVTMSDGKPLSLAENDMVALKISMRLGFLPVKDEAFSILTPKATSGGGDSDTQTGGGDTP